MFHKVIAVISTIILGTTVTLTRANEARIEAYKSPFHVGESVMACGKLVATEHLSNRHYLNMDKTYPNQTLTILIWNKDYRKFEARLGNIDSYIGRRFCARGTIEDYKGSMQMQVTNPQFLRLMNE